VTAESHAAFFQLLDIDDGDNDICILQGSGENVKMNTPAGQDSCSFTAAPGVPVFLSVLFTFSRSGAGGPFSNAVVLAPLATDDSPMLRIVSVTSEDSTDNDDNDTFLTIAVFDPAGLGDASPISTATAVKTLNSDVAAFSTTATSKYSTGDASAITISVGNFAGNSTRTDFSASAESWGAVSGKVTDDTTTDPSTNYLIFQFAFQESTLAGLENATLYVNGLLPYTGARPTGFTDVSWYNSLVGTSVTLIE
jgi:hypothetical protein